MHSVYELNQDHPYRRAFECLVDWRQILRATFDLKDHIEDVTGIDPIESPWFEQFDEIENTEHIVGVFPYATLKTLWDYHQIVLDDTGSIIGDVKHHLEAGALLRLATGLEAFAEARPTTETGARHAANARAFSDFAREVADIVAEGDEEALAALDPPQLDTLTISMRRGVLRQYHRVRGGHRRGVARSGGRGHRPERAAPDCLRGQRAGGEGPQPIDRPRGDAGGHVHGHELQAALSSYHPNKLHEADFESLANRWEGLDELESRCLETTEARQKHLSSEPLDGSGPRDKPSLFDYLYQSLDVDYPVLATGVDMHDQIRISRRTLSRIASSRG